ncbi:MAG: YebC/PmpR family DNA-binding transcriptional regulator [Cyanobacteria bacterium P01_H01_bin.74]
MAGHSKWSQIKRAKAVKDAKKGANFAQRAREIMMAVKLGGPDPDANFRLRTAIDKAKTDGVPNDNIKRAIEKGSGTGNSDDLQEMTYEGYGPGGVAIFIEAVTDNKNRTAGDIRSYFNKYNGNLGADGCVAWIFEQKTVIKVPLEAVSENRLLDDGSSWGITDFDVQDATENMDSHTEPACYQLYADPSQLNAVCVHLNQAGIPVLSAEWTREPSNTVSITEPDSIQPLLKLMEALETHDDVQQVYANVELPNFELQNFEQT